MAKAGRSEDLRRFIESAQASGRNVSMMDDNLRAIERFVRAAANPQVGVISVYRPLDEDEIRTLSQEETDEIANAYHVEFEGSDKVYYITYKPQVEKSRGKTSRLEHVNRSTPFVQMLLDKISNEYSFLYCRSRVRADESVPLPPAAKGFGCTEEKRERLEGKNKYELFFLIECKDNIDTNERLSNIIDSVLLDVDGASDDFFAHMTYAPLEHAAQEDETETPRLEPAVQRQLNSIVTQIRESEHVRRRILDFLVENESSDLCEHMRKRNEAFRAAQEATHTEVNALNSTVTCRMMPIGVFLNTVDNDRITYTVRGTHGESATFSEEINPTKTFRGHVCPHCGKRLADGCGIVLAETESGYAVGCTACAAKCERKGCNRYAFRDDGCVICHKILCREHSRKSVDSSDRLCDECARVFNLGSNTPLSPRDAAVRGQDENYVEREVLRLGKTGALNTFRNVKLLRKSECVRCKTRDGYKYYKENEADTCDACGEYFYRGDLRPESDTGKKLCMFDRVDCSCGKPVAKEKAKLCGEKDCEHGFCEACARKAPRPASYYAAVKVVSARKVKAVYVGDTLYCNKDIKVCKVCGKPFPSSQMFRCAACGGYFCKDCGAPIGNVCNTCEKISLPLDKIAQQLHSPARRKRINAIPFRERRNTAVYEDYESVVFVTPVAHGKKIRRHNKVTGNTEEWLQ